MNHPSEFAALFKLPIEQRIQLAEELWESVADETPALPVPQWQLKNCVGARHGMKQARPRRSLGTRSRRK